MAETSAIHNAQTFIQKKNASIRRVKSKIPVVVVLLEEFI